MKNCKKKEECTRWTSVRESLFARKENLQVNIGIFFSEVITFYDSMSVSCKKLF